MNAPSAVPSNVGQSLSTLVTAHLQLCQGDIETLNKVTSAACEKYDDMMHPAAVIADFLGAKKEKQGGSLCHRNLIH